ncbi:MAG TPA: trigger factor [Candidatus Binataceae bacterium]|nr:trigger factor [Candidatus Binataceae bacterium]
MNINIENASALRRKVTIELEPDEINRELDRSYNELRRTVHLKGFRPGHAPRQLLERFFGDQIRSDVIQKLIKESTEKVLAENEFKPVAAPEIVTEETDLAKTLRFSAVFDVKPELEIKDYQELKVPRPKIEVSDQDVEEALQRLRERLAPLKKVTDRNVVEAGDLVIAEIEGFEDGKAIPGSKTEARLLEVSDQSLQHGLHEVMIGAAVGTPVHKVRSYNAEYQERELAGKTVEWRVLVKEIFRRELPALDDEFAKDHGECQTLDELRGKLRERLLEHAREEADARVRQGLLDIVIERNPVEVPESLVARERQSMEAEMAAMLQASGMPREQAIERAHQSREEFGPRAEKRARSALIVDALAEQEKVEISDDEVAERVARQVTQSGERERTARFYAEPENLAALKQSMRREKTLRLLLDRAQFEDAEEPAPEKESPEPGA